MKQYPNRIKHSFVLLFVFCLIAIDLSASANELVWNEVTARGSYRVAGYTIYYGTSSGNYTQSKDVGNVTSYPLSNLNINESEIYYMVVAAYTVIGEEGFFSNEVNTGSSNSDSDTIPPLITSGPLADSIGVTAATISWGTDESSDSTVRYDVFSTSWGSYGGSESDWDSVSTHSIYLNGLAADTTYY